MVKFRFKPKLGVGLQCRLVRERQQIRFDVGWPLIDMVLSNFNRYEEF